MSNNSKSSAADVEAGAETKAAKTKKRRGVTYTSPRFAPAIGVVRGQMTAGLSEDGAIARTDYVRWLYMETGKEFSDMNDKSLNGQPNPFFNSRAAVLKHLNDDCQGENKIVYQTVQQATTPVYGAIPDPQREAAKIAKAEAKAIKAQERAAAKEAKAAAKAKAEAAAAANASAA